MIQYSTPVIITAIVLVLDKKKSPENPNIDSIFTYSV